MSLTDCSETRRTNSYILIIIRLISGITRNEKTLHQQRNIENKAKSNMVLKMLNNHNIGLYNHILVYFRQFQIHQNWWTAQCIHSFFTWGPGCCSPKSVQTECFDSVDVQSTIRDEAKAASNTAITLDQIHMWNSSTLCENSPEWEQRYVRFAKWLIALVRSGLQLGNFYPLLSYVLSKIG